MTAARRKCIKVSLERVTRTDLICVACGRFRTEWALVPGGQMAEFEAVAGVHTGCIDQLAVRHTRKREAKVLGSGSGSSGVDPEDVRS